MSTRRSNSDRLKDIAVEVVYKKFKCDRDVFNEALYCLDHNMRRDEAIRKLSKLLSRSKSKDIVECLYDATSSIRKRKNSDREEKSNEEHIEVKEKIFKAPNIVRVNDRELSDKNYNNNNRTDKEINVKTVPNKYIVEASEKAKNVNLLHSKIQESLAKYGLGGIVDNSSKLIDPSSQSVNVKLDESGQTVDSVTGLPVTLIQHTPTTKINVRTKRKQLVKAISNEVKKNQLEKKVEKSLTDSEHFDSRIKIKDGSRFKKEFRFNEPGKFCHIAETKRTKTQLELLQDKIDSISKKTGIASATKLAMITIKHTAEVSGKTPDIEWWDCAILPSQTYDQFNKFSKEYSIDSLNDNTILNKFAENLVGITNLIEHPIERLPPGEAKDNAIPIFLTKREQKKIRMQRRRQHEKEKQENILLGLIPPPPPKVKMSNLMRILGTEAVQDPTKVEAYVKQQIEARKTAHEKANNERKLTPAQKKAKLIKKYNEDTSLAVHIAVYRILDLSNHSKKFKVDKNAQQNFMTGCLIIHQDMNLLILEGGPKAQKRMKRLLLHRIKWADDSIRTQAKNTDSTTAIPNKCTLVWEGTNGYRNFKGWEIVNSKTESSAREFLKKHLCDQYWEVATSLALTQDSTV